MSLCGCVCGGGRGFSQINELSASKFLYSCFQVVTFMPQYLATGEFNDVEMSA